MTHLIHSGPLDIPGESSFRRQRKLLLRAAFIPDERALHCWNEWRKAGRVDAVDDGSYPAVPFLFRNLENRGLAPQDLNRLKGVYRFFWVQNQRLLGTLMDVLRVVGAVNVDVVLLGGAAVLFRGDPEEFSRPVESLDLLVPRADVVRTIDVLGSRGWRLEPSARSLDAVLMRALPGTALYNSSGTRCNVNWAPAPGATWEGAARIFWEHTSKLTNQDVSASVLTPTLQLLQVCMHDRYYGASPPVICLADALGVLRRAGAAVDWTQLLDLAAAYQVTFLVEQALSFLRAELAAPVPLEVVESLQRRPISRVERLQRDLARPSDRRDVGRRLLLRWLLHSRSLKGVTAVRRVLQFPGYLRSVRALPRRPWVGAGKRAVERSV